MSAEGLGATAADADLRPRDGGRFARTAGGHEVLDIAAEVARAAARPGEDPTMITRARFDEQWRKMGAPGLSSKGLRKRFDRKSLRALLTMALAPVAERGFASRDGSTPQVASNMPLDVMKLCVKACAHQLGRTPSRAMFDEWAERHARQRARAGGPEHVLPCGETLISRFGDWSQVLVAAELDPERAPKGGGSRERVLDVTDVLDRFICDEGFLPPVGYFDEWCQQQDIAVTRGGRLWSSVVAEVRERRAAAGHWTPTKVRLKRDCPELGERISSDPTGPKRRRKRITEDDCLESLRIYGRELLPPGQHPTQKHYRGCAATDRRLVAPSSLQRFGRFQELCQRVEI